MGFWVDEFVLRYINVRYYGFLSMMVQVIYVLEDDVVFFEDFGFVVIVDVEMREQNFVFICGQCVLYLCQ